MEDGARRKEEEQLSPRSCESAEKLDREILGPKAANDMNDRGLCWDSKKP